MSQKQVEAFYAASAQAEQLVQRKPEKEQFLLRVWGKATKNSLFRGRYGQPNEVDPTGRTEASVYARQFDNKIDRQFYLDAIKRFCFLLHDGKMLTTEVLDTPLAMKRVVAVVMLQYEGAAYEVRESYGYGADPRLLVTLWEQRGRATTVGRFELLEHFHPGVVSRELLESDTPPADLVEVIGMRFILVD